MRILMCSPSAGNAGHALYTSKVCGALAEAGMSVTWLAIEGLAPRFAANGVTQLPILPRQIPSSEFSNRTALIANRALHVHQVEARIAKHLRAGRQSYDIVHFQEFLPWIAPLMLQQARRAGLKTVATVHNLRPHRYLGIPRPVLDGLFDRFHRGCDGLAFHTPGLQHRSAELFAHLGESVVAPHGPFDLVGSAEFRPQADGRPIVLLAGRLRRNKGLQAFLDMADLTPEMTFRFAGQPDDPGLAQWLQDESTRRPNVELKAGFLSDAQLADEIRAAAVIAVPYEAFDGASGIVELAVSAGKRILASDRGGLPERLGEQFGCAVVAHADGAPAYVAALRGLLTSVGALGSAGPTAAPPWSEHALALIDLYRRVLKLPVSVTTDQYNGGLLLEGAPA